MGAMTDEAKALVERLRNKSKWLESGIDIVEEQDVLKAADLIETQAREIERLRGLVQYYLEGSRDW